MRDCPYCGHTHAFHFDCRWSRTPGGAVIPPPAVAVGAPDACESRSLADEARTAAAPRSKAAEQGYGS